MHVVLDAFSKPLSVSVLCDEHYADGEARELAVRDAKAAERACAGEPVWAEVDLLLPCVACFKQGAVSRGTRQHGRVRTPRVPSYSPETPLLDWEKELLGL
jgi:hypothetical protein